jgi:hypothetical protein
MNDSQLLMDLVATMATTYVDSLEEIKEYEESILT